MSGNVRVTWNDRRARAAAAAGTRESVKRSGDKILEKANRDVPFMFGHLEDSGRVSLSEDGTKAVVSYNTVYAARLHEHPEYHFRNGRHGKWLERATRESAREVLEEEATAMKRHFIL